jgi:hypothetical protein
MKTQIIYLISALLISMSSALKAQDLPEEYLGLPGDNLNLYAVMNLFQQSETLEGFERELNKQDHMVNNLDLNRDGYVDYIMVYNYVDGNIHHIALRVALNEREQQDVAVFIVEQLRSGAVHVQLIGDEALYGPNYIIEPAYAETPNPGYTGVVAETKVKKRRNVTVVRTTYYEVASWPVIVYIYRPSYVVYHSPWRWSYYPVYWHSWTPHYWHYYYGYHYNWYSHYYAHYRPGRQPRNVHYYTFYHTNIRNYSPTVVVNINKGVYKNTYSRPETRSAGEVLYTQRRSTGSNIPQGRESAATRESRQDQRPNADVNTRTTRSANEGISTTNGREGQSKSETRQVAEPSRSRTETVSPGRNERSTEVSRKGNERREATASPQRTETRSKREDVQAPAREHNVSSERPANRPSESRVTNSKSRENSPATSRSVEKPSTDSKRSTTPSATSVSRSEHKRATSVQKSQPSRSETKSPTTVRPSERNIKSKPATKEVKSERSETRQKSNEADKNNTRTRGR